jgi:UrcA family protein
MEINVMLQPNLFYALSMSCCFLAFESTGCVSSAVQTLPNSEEVLQKKVSYAGLDLNSVTGAQILLHRLNSAVEQVCEPFDGQRLEQKYLWHECHERALANAIREVNHPQVTMLYEASERKTMFP